MYSRVKRPRRPVQGMMYSPQKNKPHQTKLTGDCHICKTYVICVVYSCELAQDRVGWQALL